MAPVIRTAFSPNICSSCFRKWYENESITLTIDELYENESIEGNDF